MKKLLRRIRGAIGMGITWAIAWGLVGGVMELIDREGALVDIWPIVLALPGFVGGVIFSLVFAIAEGRRRFEELSLPRFGALGAAVGVLLGALAVAAGAADGAPLLMRGALVVLPVTLLAAGSASATLALARRAQGPASLGAGPDVDDVGLTESEKRELLGGSR